MADQKDIERPTPHGEPPRDWAGALGSDAETPRLASVAEDVVYVVTGEIIRHEKRRRKAAETKG